MTKSIIVETWTECERGWGCRPDGMTAHLSMEDHKKFVQDYNKKFNNRPVVPDCYTVADMNPMTVVVEEGLYQHLLKARAEGELGLWAPDREGEKLLLQGKNPFEPEEQDWPPKNEGHG